VGVAAAGVAGRLRAAGPRGTWALGLLVLLLVPLLTSGDWVPESHLLLLLLLPLWVCAGRWSTPFNRLGSRLVSMTLMLTAGL
jgi:hypothetical protein